LNEKHLQLKTTAKELIEAKLKNDEFLIELNKVKDELARFVEEFDKKNKEQLEFINTIKSFEEKNKATQKEIESLVGLNDKIARSNSEMMEREQELTEGLQLLEVKINDLEIENNLLKESLNQRNPKIGELIECKEVMQKEIELLRAKCRQYEIQLEDYDKVIKKPGVKFDNDGVKQELSSEKYHKLEKTLKVKLKDETSVELEALRDHARMLESQNNAVSMF